MVTEKKEHQMAAQVGDNPVGSGTFISNTPTMPAVVAIGTSGAQAVYATSDTSSSSISGISVSTSTNTSGVYGQSVYGKGVYGKSSLAQGIGVCGENEQGNGVMGMSQDGIGVAGSSVNGRGVYAKSNKSVGVHGVSTAGNGILGESTSAPGVAGSSSNAVGVYGTSPTSYGVEGYSAKNIGTYGHSTEGAGICGYTEGTTANAVGGLFRCQNPGQAWAGYFYGSVGCNLQANNYVALRLTSSGAGWGSGMKFENTAPNGKSYGIYSGDDGKFRFALTSTLMYLDQSGNLTVTGNVSAANIKMVLDHPLNPANKSLSHGTVASAERKTIYDGVVHLDGQGEAEVTLPSWFEALNTEFRYQLTALGASAPNLYIAQEIQGNHFKIAGGVAGMKVCWQVTGIRHDAWAKANPFVVEEEKPAEQIGRYYHPEVFGESGEKAIGYQNAPSQETREILQEDERPEPRPIPTPLLSLQE